MKTLRSRHPLPPRQPSAAPDQGFSTADSVRNPGLGAVLHTALEESPPFPHTLILFIPPTGRCARVPTFYKFHAIIVRMLWEA